MNNNKLTGTAARGISMEMKQNPFSFYDFLGYFTPGAITVYSVALAYGYSANPGDPTAFISEQFGKDNAALYVPFVLFSYVLGHLLSFASSVTVERYSIWSLGYPSKYLLRQTVPSYYDVPKPVWLRRVGRTCCAFILLPITVCDLAFGRALNLRDLYAKPLDPLLAQVLGQATTRIIDVLGFREVADSENKKPGGLAQHDFFRLVYHFAVENASAHYPKMQNYVALYGFLRTISFVFVALFWILVWQVVRDPQTVANPVTTILLVTLITYTTYAGFVKFYRRFSLEALMAAAVLANPSASPKG